MIKMKRIQRERIKGWKMPHNAIYVGRASKWGNPWRIGERHPADGHRLTREEVIELYRNNIQQMLKTRRFDGSFILNLEELKGKDLACWCSLNEPCHADILLEILKVKERKEQNGR